MGAIFGKVMTGKASKKNVTRLREKYAWYYTKQDATMVAEVSCNLTPRHPPSQVLDNLPRYGS
jgi:hypothetical protein